MSKSELITIVPERYEFKLTAFKKSNEELFVIDIQCSYYSSSRDLAEKLSLCLKQILFKDTFFLHMSQRLVKIWRQL